MRLSVELTTGFTDPRGMKRNVVIHSSPHTDSVWVPRVRTSVRGSTKTGRSPIKALSFSLFRHHQSSGAPSFALLAKGGKSRICGEALRGQSRGIPPFAKSAKDGAPEHWVLRLKCFFSESRKQSINATGLNGKSGA